MDGDSNNNYFILDYFIMSSLSITTLPIHKNIFLVDILFYLFTVDFFDKIYSPLMKATISKKLRSVNNLMKNTCVLSGDKHKSRCPRELSSVGIDNQEQI